jgi:hypothetical protein
VCDQEISKTRRLKPATGLWKIQPQWIVTPRKQTNNKHIEFGRDCLRTVGLIKHFRLTLESLEKNDRVTDKNERRLAEEQTQASRSRPTSNEIAELRCS